MQSIYQAEVCKRLLLSIAFPRSSSSSKSKLPYTQVSLTENKFTALSADYQCWLSISVIWIVVDLIYSPNLLDSHERTCRPSWVQSTRGLPLSSSSRSPGLLAFEGCIALNPFSPHQYTRGPWCWRIGVRGRHPLRTAPKSFGKINCWVNNCAVAGGGQLQLPSSGRAFSLQGKNIITIFAYISLWSIVLA